MKWFVFILLSAVTVALLWTLNTKLGDIPPMGKLLSPYSGFWQNNESGKISSEILNLHTIRDDVNIYLDDNLVPHLFAKNNHDLYFAQGFIHAKYRLWQMEFQTLAAAGRISEVIGPKAVSYDLQQRRFGMVFGAEHSLKGMESDPDCKEAIESYTEGVNAWISQLNDRSLPIEYKLLDYKPEPWTTLKCALLLKYMTYDLAGHSDDFYVTNILKKYGQEAIDSLFINDPYFHDPIIPPGTSWDFSPLPIPASPGNYLANVPDPPFDHQPDPSNGSNNWAVNGSKTASGSAILCGDPHLSLNLPSLWFQMQLVAPGCNVTGVSLPGSPSIIIGFNDKMAWSETNTDADVLDWYSVKFRDQSRQEYFYNNEWKPVSKRIEVIKVRGGEDVTDTVIYTSQGPIVALREPPYRDNIPQGFAMRWLGHDESIELKAFLLFNRGSGYDDYVKALNFFECPAQNFAYADAENNIAIWVNGKYPLKWKNQGKFLLDGSNPANDWQGWIPHEQDPHVKNPPRGFISSANQTPADTSYPYYLNWQFESFTRAHRLNERLENMSGITADSMRLLQDDDQNLIAQYTLPAMISKVDMAGLSEQGKAIIESLSQWNFKAGASEPSQTVFNRWWNNLSAAIWNDEFGSSDMMYPALDASMRTVTMNRNQEWVDNKNTPEKETLDQLINKTFSAALDSLNKNYGSDWKQWQWGKVKNTNISHLLRIPAFSDAVNAGGGSGMINATSATHGPSWRMIVEMGSHPHGYGIYPGGQSGNPGSPFYDNMVNDWSNGVQKELVVMKDESENNSKIVGTITLKKH